jgi:dihydrofolate reductase
MRTGRDGGFEHGGWTGPFMSEYRRYITEGVASVGALLLGRKTYEIFASYWPTVVAQDDEIARVFNRVPKHVVSAALGRGDWRR